MEMKPFIPILLAVALASGLTISPASAQTPLGTQFTYQGLLKDGGVTFPGTTATMTFELFDALTLGASKGTVGPIVVPVTNGLFTVPLNFGSDVFNGESRWLKITVDGVPLSPRQEITVAPYALQTRGIFVDAAENVGIGTTNPSSPLHVSGSSPTNPGSGQIRIDGTETTGAADTGSGVRLVGHDGNIARDLGTIQALKENSIVGNTRSYLRLSTRGATGAVTEQMRIDSNGNVGIGTASPDFKLQVEGGTDVSPAGGGFAVLGSSTGFNIAMDSNEIMARNNGATATLALNANGGNVNLVQDGGGNVGIGTDAPTSLLHLSSLGGIDLLIEADTNNVGKDQNARIVLSQDGGIVKARMGYRSGLNKLEIVNERNDSLILGTNNTDQITITSAGDVGIGTSTPSTNLHIVDDDLEAILRIGTPTTDAVEMGFGLFGSFLSVNDASGNSVISLTGVDGRITGKIVTITGADLAEKFPVSEKGEPGTVMEIDPAHQGTLRVARGAYNRRVAGVVSGANDLSAGVVLGNLPGHEDAPPIALSGRVWTMCDASGGPIAPGDLLTTSDTPGHAMKVTDYSKAQGAIIGKAMSALESGRGLVLVLVSLQ